MQRCCRAEEKRSLYDTFRHYVSQNISFATCESVITSGTNHVRDDHFAFSFSSLEIWMSLMAMALSICLVFALIKYPTSTSWWYPLETEWQQVSATPRDSTQLLIRSQLSWDLNGFNSFMDIKYTQSLLQTLWMLQVFLQLRVSLSLIKEATFSDLFFFTCGLCSAKRADKMVFFCK